MKHLWKLAAVLVLFAPPCLADDLPTRKEGLWVVKTTVPGLPPQEVKQCVDAESDRKLMEMGKSVGSEGGMKCTSGDLRKVGDAYVSESECRMAEMRMKVRSSFRGNFEESYTGETITEMEPAIPGMPVQKLTFSARWLGPCEPGQKPGDVFFSDGRRMNIDSMEGLAGAR